MKIPKKLIRYLSGVLSVTIISLAPCCVNAAKFSDVEGHWAESVIEKWADKDIIRGYGGYFNPDASIIRGDFAVIISRILPSDKDNTLENVFTDLNDGEYYTDAILRLNKRGVILGSDGKVYPNDNITREEAFVMLSRAYNINGTSAESISFDDSSDISEWAYDVICAMCKQGMIKGSSDNKIHPKDSITRAEVVQLLENINDKINVSNNENKTDSTISNGSSSSSGSGVSHKPSGGSGNSAGSSGSSGSSGLSGSSSSSGSDSSNDDITSGDINSGSGSDSSTDSDTDPDSKGGLGGSDISDIDKNIVDAGPISW